MKTKSKGFYITLWSIGIILTFLIGVYAVGTYTISPSGVFMDGNRSFVRTVDVAVCRGQNTLDDVVKAFQCDVVCLSSDTASQCGMRLNNSITNLANAGGGIIELGVGTFPNGIYIVPKSNVRIIGHGDATILQLNGTDEYFSSEGNLYNFELGHVKFSQVYSGNGVGFDVSETPTTDLYLHDIDFGNINYDCLRVTTNSNVVTVHRNVVLERIKSNNCTLVIGKANGVKILSSSFNQSSTSRNTLWDIGFSENNATVNDVLVQGNTFLNDQRNVPAISSSGNATSFRISNNHFYTNSSAVAFLINCITCRLDTIINDNNFYSYLSTSTVGLIDIRLRGADSTVKIDSNNFYGNNIGRYYGIQSVVPSLITSNNFYGLGDSCIQGRSSLIINGNYFNDCQRIVAGNRWIYLEPSTDHTNGNVISNNFFKNTGLGYTSPFIRLGTGLENSSIYDNTYKNIIVNPYQLDGATINQSYIDDYNYSSSINNIYCANGYTSPTYGKAIHNNTTSCVCIDSTWKCWSMT